MFPRLLGVRWRLSREANGDGHGPHLAAASASSETGSSPPLSSCAVPARTGCVWPERSKLAGLPASCSRNPAASRLLLSTCTHPYGWLDRLSLLICSVLPLFRWCKPDDAAAYERMEGASDSCLGQEGSGSRQESKATKQPSSQAGRPLST